MVPPLPKMAPPAPARKPVSRGLIISIVAALLVLATTAAGYFYWTGVIGDRPGSIARSMTEELNSKGFAGIAVSMGRDWVATVTGSVVGKDSKEAVEQLLRAHSEVRQLNLDGLTVQAGPDEIRAAAEKILAENGIQGATVSVGEDGAVVLTGRHANPNHPGEFGELFLGIEGVTSVDNQVKPSYAELQQSITAALHASGFRDVVVDVQSTEAVTVSGTIEDESDRGAVVDKIVATAVGMNDSIRSEAVTDQMSVVAPQVAVVPQAPAPPPAAPAEEPPEPAAAPSPTTGYAGVWTGHIRWGVVGSGVAVQLRGASVGNVVGRSEYSGSYPYCAGELRLVQESPSEIVLEEKITERNPKATCPGGGRITMVFKSATKAQASWDPVGKMTFARYKGTLQKQ